MKKQFVLFAGLFVAGQTVFAQGEDSLRMVRLEAVEVTSTRAAETTPIAFSNMNRQEIEEVNFGQDMPSLLQMMPSVVVTSDAGVGIGYTGIWIRGTDPTRINVTTNGIPLNDAESHGHFWVNVPDMASSLDNIQMQRGVGTSTNGAGAFGGSINLRTESMQVTPHGEFSGSYGSFNTHKEMLKFGTGLMGGRWAFSGRLSNIASDGYRDRASASLKSFFAQGAYYGRTTVVRMIAFGGRERTYHAWDGIDRYTLENDRRYNPSGAMENADGDVVGFYDNQTDNYTQYNYQLLVTQSLGSAWNLNVALHYTDGEGYYEEYKNGRKLQEYGLTPFTIVAEQDGVPAEQLVKKSNLVRRKMMDNGFGGGVFSLDYKGDRLRASLGGAFNRYVGDHFGRVIWVQNYAGDSDFQPDHRYYENTGKKNDANVYVKADWEVVDRLHLFGDLQYRRINYKITGANDTWDPEAGAMQRLDVDKDYDFFNPKAGAFYEINRNMKLYGSVAVAHREPTRNNFTDARRDVDPRAERLIDYEAGFVFSNDAFRAGANFYYMDYKDQLVLTGEVNHIGEPLTDNVAESYRAGVELTAGVRITRWLDWNVNATFSRNRIKNYTEYVTLYDADWNDMGQTANHLGTTPISFSPDITAGSLLTARVKNFTVALQSNYVGKQYLTNSGLDEISLDAYFVNSLRLGYSFKAPSFSRISVGLSINNIFDVKYCSNGYGWSSYLDGAEGRERMNEAYFFPQAGTNLLANVTVRF